MRLGRWHREPCVTNDIVIVTTSSTEGRFRIWCVTYGSWGQPSAWQRAGHRCCNHGTGHFFMPPAILPACQAEGVVCVGLIRRVRHRSVCFLRFSTLARCPPQVRGGPLVGRSAPSGFAPLRLQVRTKGRAHHLQYYLWRKARGASARAARHASLENH